MDVEAQEVTPSAIDDSDCAFVIAIAFSPDGKVLASLHSWRMRLWIPLPCFETTFTAHVDGSMLSLLTRW